MLKNLSLKNIMPVVLIAGISFSANAKSIKDLTSKSTSKKVDKQVQEVAQMTGTGLKEHSVGIGIGQTFLGGDFSADGDDKITPDLYYNYSASHSFDFMANFHYTTHNMEDRSVDLAAIAFGIKAKMYNFDAFAPYLLGGVGFYHPIMERDLQGTITKSESKTTFGYHLGAGAELDLNNKVRIGILGHLHNPFDVKQENQPEIEGYYYKLLLLAFYKF